MARAAGTAPGGERRLVVATSNAGKAREVREILAVTGWSVVTPADLGLGITAPAETGRSYLENAIAKATAAARDTGLPAIADDSGLEVDALDGRPGPLSARFGGPALTSDAQRWQLLLRMLDGVPTARRAARFRCVVALALPGNRVVTREGVVEGRIAQEARGDGGFGYDPVFELPDGRTVAQIGAEKHLISHRSQALRAIAEVLRTL